MLGKTAHDGFIPERSIDFKPDLSNLYRKVTHLSVNINDYTGGK